MPPHLALGDFAPIAALPPAGACCEGYSCCVARLHRHRVRGPGTAATARLAPGRERGGEYLQRPGDPACLHLVDMLIAVSGKPVRIELDPARLRGQERSTIFGDPTLLHHLAGRDMKFMRRSKSLTLWQRMS